MRFMILMLAAVMLPAGAATAVAQEAAVYGATYVEVAPGATSQAIALLKTLGTASRKEDGNLLFEVVQQTNRPNHFTVVEIWKDGKAFDAHGTAEHTRRFRANLGPMLGAPYEDRVYMTLE